jgi:predicted RNase H-like HicB family nuclease
MMSNTATIEVLIHRAQDGGYWAEVPALPGCYSQGQTVDEVQTNVQEAVEGWLVVASENDSLTITNPAGNLASNRGDPFVAGKEPCMTVVVAVMNRVGVALAADSAATGLEEAVQHKTYTSAEKLFQLAPDIPVGVMVYGRASFFGGI